MRRIASLAAVAALASGCGGSGAPQPRDTRAGDPPAGQEGALRAPASANAVIRGWADDLRRGDVRAASERFALPAVVANGTPELQLETRAAVRLFNRTLPCGARLVASEEHHGYVIGTFELTDRPGGDCGSGTGNTARTAFLIRDGLIVRWIRVPEGGELRGPDGPVV